MINFTEFLSVQDFLTLSNCVIKYDAVQLITDKVKNSIIICGKCVYFLHNLNTYEVKEYSSDLIVGIIVKYLSMSAKKLSKTDYMLLQGNKNFPKLFRDSFVKTEISSYKISLTQDKIKFDFDLDGIHFKNGRFNLKTGKLEERTPIMYITKYINRDYKEPTKEEIIFIDSCCSKLFRDEETKKYTFYELGISLSGRSTKRQQMICFYGKGSAGKTTLLDIYKESLGDEVYFKLLPSDAFCKNKNNDKILNGFTSNIRLYFVDEIDSKTLDTSILKKICDGDIKAKQLYRDGVHKVDVYGTLIINSNMLITFSVDSGSKRRIIGYEYKNKFVDEKDYKLVNNTTIFKKIKGFSKTLTEGQLNAYFYILARYCKKWYDGVALKLPDSYKEAKDELIDANDWWADFVDEHLIKNRDGKFGKKEILELVRNSEDSKKHLTFSQVLSHFKDLGIEYKRKIRVNGVQGAFVGYKIKDDDDIEFINEDEIENKGDKDELILKLQTKVKKLELKLKKYKKLKKSSKTEMIDDKDDINTVDIDKINTFFNIDGKEIEI